ncbi:MAG: hypothetical protein OXN94_18310 [Chloroflexota bacterium]|nr:hypothetical protein [Chloroflexota bacterium]MDE2859807.1 hypothetical protein [Chloroflexota bacterium]MDE2950860.1 hypothetical protein [Chloroflexota bacterium]
MRLGWSVLCRNFEMHDDGSLSIERVFADSILGIEITEPPPILVALNPTVILLSHWFKESDLDNKRYPAVLRILAPGDNEILAEWHFAIDLLQSDSSLSAFQIAELEFVGNGFYEFHIEVLEFGEWHIQTRNSLYIRNNVS